MVQDKFYGFQELAELCEHVITSLFSITPSNQQGLDTPPPSPPLGVKESPPPLVDFIAYALYRTRLPTAITHQALLLLSRLKARYPSARGTSTSPHRLFLSSLMLSSKISQDDTYSNKSWQVVSQGLFTLREVNQMERELFAFLGWNVVVRDEELTAWVKEVVEVYELEKGVRSPAKCSAVAPRPTLEDRKRRRDQSRDSSSPSSSCSRGSSPEARHHRASHAAAALLGLPKPKRRTSARIQDRRISPYSSRPSSTFSSSSSSCFASPMLGSGATTPGSPSTPNSDGGPITPDHVDQCLAPAWAQTCFLPIKERQYSTRINGSIVEVTSW